MPETCFFLGSLSSGGDAPGHLRHFPCQGLKNSPRRKTEGFFFLFRPQALHPFSHLGNRPGHTPSNQKEGRQGNDKGIHQKADEIIFPDQARVGPEYRKDPE